MNRTPTEIGYRDFLRAGSDIATCVVYVLLVDLVLLVPSPESVALRSILGLPLLLFVPGYVLLAALFPLTKDDAPDVDTDSTGILSTQGSVTPSPTGSGTMGRIDLPARLALSFGMSLSLLPVIGLFLSLAPVSTGLLSLLAVISGIVLVGGGLALVRRNQAPAMTRFEPDPWRTVTESVRGVFHGRTTVDTALNVALVVAVLATTATVGLGLTVPNQGDSFTEVTLLTENESGSYSLADYPRNLTAGESTEMVLEVHNAEGEAVDYTAVVQLQRVETSNTSTTVEERQTVARLEERVPAGETQRLQHEVTPEMTGSSLKLTYLVYREPPPAEPNVDSAYRTLHLWVNVSDG